MNKGIAKKARVITIALFLLGVSVFADSHKPNSKEGKHGHGKGFTYNKRSADSKADIGTAGYQLMGDWVFRGTDKAVKVEFDRDGTMEIKWHQGFDSETEWEGFWTATDTEITFTVKTKETETWINGAKKEVRENINATWKIQYSRTDDTLTLTGSDLPKELANLQLSRTGRWH